MPEGTPIVRNVPLKFDRAVPAGPPLYPGDPRVVEAWNLRARREFRTFRFAVIALVGMAVVSAVGQVAPTWAAVAALGAAAVAYPLAAVAAGGRIGQKPFDIFEKGVHGTERRRLLRFRRFAPFSEIVKGEAREAAPSKFHVRLVLIDGTALESVPGEVGKEAVDFLHARTGEQVSRLLLPAPREKAVQRNS